MLVSPHKVESIYQEIDEEIPAPANLKETRQLFRDSQKNVQTITKKAAALGITFLEEQAQNLEAVDNAKAAMIRKRIAKAEDINKMYLKLCRYLNPQGQSSLNHLKLPDEDPSPCLAHIA
jgi:DNA-binding ferritin-like protein